MRKLSGDCQALLDVGAGTGAFAEAAIREGLVVEAVEPVPDCRDELLSVGVKSVYESIASLDQRGARTYDVISLWHVLEHLPEPEVALKVLARHLTSDGFLIVDVPNADSWSLRVFTSRWPHLDPPRHVFVPTADGLRQLALRCGLDLEVVRGPDVASWEAFSLASLGARAQEPRGIKVGRRITQRLLSPLALIVPVRRRATFAAVLRPLTDKAPDAEMARAAGAGGDLLD